MLNPLTYMSPEQRQQLEQLKAVGRRVKAQVHKRPPNRVEVVLNAEDQEAEAFLAHFLEGLCQSVGQSLNMFAIEGEIIEH